MSPFKRKAEIILHGVKLTIDAEDEARIIVEEWQIDRAPNVPMFYRPIGPIRKSNLRVSPRSSVKQKGPLRK